MGTLNAVERLGATAALLAALSLPGCVTKEVDRERVQQNRVLRQWLARAERENVEDNKEWERLMQLQETKLLRGSEK